MYCMYTAHGRPASNGGTPYSGTPEKALYVVLIRWTFQNIAAASLFIRYTFIRIGITHLICVTPILDN